jgi:hypothetical protein
LRSPLSKPQIITSLQVKNSLDSQTSLLSIMDEISKMFWLVLSFLQILFRDKSLTLFLQRQ